MSDVIIKINNLSKMYNLAQVGTGTLASDLQRWWANLRGKEDPSLKLGETNDRTKKGSSDLVWALKDINIEVEKGDVLGIVGKNGAGKSTLLKILSRTTTPTTGEFKVKGRIASLLEVGTGFHPDLTGRENIYLNGAILGMTKREISSKFDEIVDFSGVERYIDTPVKRYSSGMYVRLAFSVAAHLESEILILDEVLAVGDTEFQKKCLGKMGDVSSKEGRTVLFVSHNMAAVKNLCTRGVLLKNGVVSYSGAIQPLLDNYYYGDSIFSNTGEITNEQRTSTTGEATFKRAFICNPEGKKVEELYFKQNFKLKTEFEVSKKIKSVCICINITNADGETIVFSSEGNEKYAIRDYEPGNYSFDIDYDIVLMPRKYSITINMFYSHSGGSIDYVERVYHFNVLNLSLVKDGDYHWSTVHGYVEPKTKWTLNKL